MIFDTRQPADTDPTAALPCVVEDAVRGLDVDRCAEWLTSHDDEIRGLLAAKGAVLFRETAVRDLPPLNGTTPKVGDSRTIVWEAWQLRR